MHPTLEPVSSSKVYSAMVRNTTIGVMAFLTVVDLFAT